MKITKRKDETLYINSLDDFNEYMHQNHSIKCLKNATFEWIYEKLKEIDSISITMLDSHINKILTLRYPNRGSQTCLDYYLIRGYELDAANKEIIKTQRSRSKRCKEYWIKKGYTEEGAQIEVTKFQKDSSKKGNAPKTEEYWIALGKTEEDSKILARQYSRENTSRCIEYWILNGYTEKEAREKISKNADNGSLKYFTSKYGIEEGKIQYEELNKRKARHGSENSQYGKPAPKGSGRGISGYYKQYYFRSTFEYFAIKMFEETNTPFQELDVLGSKFIVILSNNRTYRPDFLINDNTIVEVKPSGLLNEESVLLKQKCCLEQYPQFDYKFLTEKDLPIDMSILKSDVDNNIVIIDKGKLMRYNKNIKSLG